MMSRLFEWFTGQGELIQAAMIGRYSSEIEPDVAKLILKQSWPVRNRPEAPRTAQSLENRIRRVPVDSGFTFLPERFWNGVATDGGEAAGGQSRRSPFDNATKFL